MAYKVYSWQKPRKEKGEFFALPSLTDQLADEPLERIINRFIASGSPLPLMDGEEIKTGTEEELDSVFERLGSADVSGLTKDEQLQVLADAQALASALQTKIAKAKESRKTATEPSAEKTESNDSMVDGKTE